MSILKKPYEISIWDDFTPNDDKKYYQERKLMIIGSDQMTAGLRAIKPIFKENVNGTHELTFTLYSRYFDEDSGDFIDNPFLPSPAIPAFCLPAGICLCHTVLQHTF